MIDRTRQAVSAVKITPSAGTLILSLLPSAILGCSGAPPPGIFAAHLGGFHSDYHISLDSTEAPAHVLGATNYLLHGKPVGEERYSDYFEDHNARILWGMNSQLINLAISNKSDSVLEVIWDESSYTNDSGHTSKLVHEGVNFFNLGYPLSPTFLPPDSSISEYVYPSTYLKYKEATEYERARWERVSLFYDADLHGPFLSGTYNTLEEYDAVVQRNAGKRVSIQLPLRASGIRYLYTFHFQVDSIRSSPGLLVKKR